MKITFLFERLKNGIGMLIPIAIFLIPLIMQSQDMRTITGSVNSEDDGMPLPGVNIFIENTNYAAITDFDGNFSLELPATKQTLTVSSVGFKTKSISVNANQETLGITLATDVAALEEVVVIGYGTSSRRNVTGAIASISGDDVAKVPVADATQALQGKLAGVNITTQDGRPGADVKVRIRGGGSISQSNQPLFIVDGFPVNTISNIPGNQIKSIDVLKDASSTAIYGSRGANGVVIVTTKSGSVGKTRITYDGFAQYSYIPEYIPVMNGYDYIAYNWAYADAIGNQYSDAWEQLWAIGRYEGSNSEGIDYYRGVDSKDFTKELFNSAFTHNHNFNITSGTEKTKYLLALNHIDQEGNKVRSFYKRSNVQFKLDQEISDRIDFTINTRFVETREGNNQGNSNAYWFRPIGSDDILGESDVTVNTQLGDYNAVLQDFYNPVSLLNDTDSDIRSRSLVANTAVNWEIIDGLTAKTNLSLSANWSRAKYWDGAIVNNYLDTQGNVLYSGDARIRAGEGWNLRWVNTLNYEVQGLGEDHVLSILAGMEISDSGSEFTDVSGNEFPASYDATRAWANMNDFLRRDDQENFQIGSQIGIPNRLQSYFGRFNYSLYDKYLFTGTFRADGSSRFAPSNRWGYFPAGAFAWRLSEENFLKETSWLDDLKLRLAYGAVGSDAISSELWKQSWASATGSYSINEVIQPLYRPASDLIANPDLKWETTITRNVGLDFTLFDRKLSGTVEVYKNTVKDLLLVRDVSPLTGFSFTQENIGSTSNKGIEISLNGDIVTSENFNLQAGINFNINRGNIDELAEGIDGLYGSNWGSVAQNPREDYIFQVGQPVGLIRGYIHDGWYTTDDFNYDPASQVYTLKEGVADYTSGLLGNVYGTATNKPGDQAAYPGVQKVRDTNGDGVIDDLDIGIIGDTNPVHTGGFNFSGNYKAIDFSLNFNWSYGNDLYNVTHQAAYLGNKEAGLFRNRFQELAGHYKIYDIVNGQLTKVVEPSALKALNANANTFLPYPESAVVSTFAIEDGSFLRLNNLTIGYTLPKPEKLGINRLRFYGSMFNVFTLTNYSGYDPEVSVDETGRSTYYPTPGFDFQAYPRPRTITLGVNLEF
ncbi:SusC/RagA family TonB-linked outer membrane protein [Leeuwenhoekiella marinoflava]|uniref:TonB-linked SusC/RagA family outer membrane protein n=2 Tax=Leeuwenhoekiella marinoflava TaxID=988 RepID=A0A4V1KSM6_9FLAO|nr:TonB-dependent receptor [Leeuwenhoekiella marinoflava]RXG32268.1 TonB-linked SusC/RagA family outer membrane protein [Leeuwenhoekiella marinoflava]SHE81161.1 TonB-linked outer membrane protein, SusC/RagA family [Leeuwenhoekiella marinoflava DSM 3653]